MPQSSENTRRRGPNRGRAPGPDLPSVPQRESSTHGDRNQDEDFNVTDAPIQSNTIPPESTTQTQPRQQQEDNDRGFGVYGGRPRGPEHARFNFVAAYAATFEKRLCYRNSRRSQIFDGIAKHVFSKFARQGLTEVSATYANYYLDKEIWDRYCRAKSGVAFPFEFMRGQEPELGGVDDWRIPENDDASSLAYKNYLDRLSSNSHSHSTDGGDLPAGFSQLNVEEQQQANVPLDATTGQHGAETIADPAAGSELETDGAMPEDSNKRRRLSESAEEDKDASNSGDTSFSLPKRRRL
ncbi:hypothetical protein QBC37DRAFT_371949 [Rhypophila decipiens]|uniref:Uncharacterized protein n=1 Tax=Rhypophila decipiens TaxID=261697 RepID=A0AAN7B7D6_9PEZI|nr:hypothetical protein QBC37DRAFT_371949 [Rhypophila decipiens]